MVRKLTFRDEASGQSLVEVMMSLAIGGIVSLGVASIFTFGIEQFQVLVDQNAAETSLLSSAFYIRSWMSQAVKINCQTTQTGQITTANQGNTVSDANGTLTLSVDTIVGGVPGNTPTNIGRGKMDCREVPASPFDISNDGGTPANLQLGTPTGYHWAYSSASPPRVNTFAMFVRDSGATNGASPPSYYSQYIPSAILFSPPSVPTDAIYNAADGNKSGVIWFYQAGSAAANNAYVNTGSTAFMKFDHIVDMGVVQGSVDPNPSPTGGSGSQNLRTLSIRVVARYHLSVYGTRDFRSGVANPAPGYATYRDIEMTIPIGFRNTYLGISATGSGSSERLYGSLYFFKFSAPPLSQFAQF